MVTERLKKLFFEKNFRYHYVNLYFEVIDRENKKDPG